MELADCMKAANIKRAGAVDPTCCELLVTEYCSVRETMLFSCYSLRASYVVLIQLKLIALVCALMQY